MIGVAEVIMNVTQFNMEYMNELFRNHKQAVSDSNTTSQNVYRKLP